MNDLELGGQINGVLLDLGVSSRSWTTRNAGFSFMRDGPLDMRMDPTRGISAAQWLTEAKEDIAWVLKKFRRRAFSKRIARAIVERNKTEEPLTRTKQLADLIAAVSPVKEKHKHPATRSFPGDRIYVNSELDGIRRGADRRTGHSGSGRPVIGYQLPLAGRPVVAVYA